METERGRMKKGKGEKKEEEKRRSWGYGQEWKADETS
jgi:hypothetical protein